MESKISIYFVLTHDFNYKIGVQNGRRNYVRYAEKNIVSHPKICFFEHT